MSKLNPNPSPLRTHEFETEAFDQILSKSKARIQQQGDKPHVTVEKQLALLDELSQFPLGRFLLQHRSVNGYWIHYVFTYPWQGKKTGLNSEGKPFTAMEKIMLDELPIILATQERFRHFLVENQQAVREGGRLASIPCGVMGELLYLDYSATKDYRIHGIDLDPQAFDDAKQCANEKNLLTQCQFHQCDAWDLPMRNEFTLVSSNGLNFYEPDDDKVTELYQQFYKTLTRDGKLVTSFLTFSPATPDKCEWNMSKLNPERLLLQRILFTDLIESRFQYFRTMSQTERQLKSVGFKNIRFIKDEANMFPTVIADKQT